MAVVAQGSTSASPLLDLIALIRNPALFEEKIKQLHEAEQALLNRKGEIAAQEAALQLRITAVENEILIMQENARRERERLQKDAQKQIDLDREQIIIGQNKATQRWQEASAAIADCERKEKEFVKAMAIVEAEGAQQLRETHNAIAAANERKVAYEAALARINAAARIEDK